MQHLDNPHTAGTKCNFRKCEHAYCCCSQIWICGLLQRFVAMADDINVKADKGECTLQVACEFGLVATVQYLCEHGALLDLQDNNGNTALHMTVSNGYLDVTRDLVEKGVNLSAADTAGSTTIHIAAKGGYLNIVQYLAGSFTRINVRNA